MSITGWRVHFTRRALAWPREVTRFMREFGDLFASLDQRVDDQGVPEGQPFVISPTCDFDLALNRYFSVWMASSSWNTQAAHARDLRTYFDFLWFARGQRSPPRPAGRWWPGGTPGPRRAPRRAGEHRRWTRTA